MQRPSSIAIVGGGTAGWMAASLLEHAWAQYGIRITLIESEAIETIGVGEGSTPSLQAFFKLLGIEESHWMPACHATYKCGIRFPHWTSHLQDNTYFHPFYSDHDWKTGQAYLHNVNLRRQGYDIESKPDPYWLQHYLAKSGKCPVLEKPQDHSLDYGYHFDSALLGKFLKNRLLKRGKVNHTIGTVEHIKSGVNGIEKLITANGEVLEADLYVDCTGFASLLLGKTLNVDFEDFSDALPNDRAVAIASKIDLTNDLIPETTSMALTHGWAWRIPLSSRFGNGYVYSSHYLSEDQAEQELRDNLGVDKSAPAKHLRMRVGRYQQHWCKNVLAVGLSQGFIEPLEATAIATLQYTVEHFIALHEDDAQLPNTSGRASDVFNQRINAIFDSIKDYICLHYRMNTRTDSVYWQDCANNKNHSDKLQAIIDAWDRPEVNFTQALHNFDAETMYFAPSWYCLLAGKGRLSKIGKTKPFDKKVASLDDIEHYCQHQASFFRDHVEQLKHIYGQQHPIFSVIRAE